MTDSNITSNRVDPDIAEVRAALSCWRHGTWTKAYAMEQFEKLLQGFVDRSAHETEGRAALCHGKAHIPITTCATCGCFIGSVADLRPAETAARIPPREFDIESHTGLYTELPLPVKAKAP